MATYWEAIFHYKSLDIILPTIAIVAFIILIACIWTVFDISDLFMKIFLTGVGVCFIGLFVWYIYTGLKSLPPPPQQPNAKAL